MRDTNNVALLYGTLYKREKKKEGEKERKTENWFLFLFASQSFLFVVRFLRMHRRSIFTGKKRKKMLTSSQDE